MLFLSGWRKPLVGLGLVKKPKKDLSLPPRWKSRHVGFFLNVESKRQHIVWMQLQETTNQFLRFLQKKQQICLLSKASFPNSWLLVSLLNSTIETHIPRSDNQRVQRRWQGRSKVTVVELNRQWQRQQRRRNWVSDGGWGDELENKEVLAVKVVTVTSRVD